MTTAARSLAPVTQWRDHVLRSLAHHMPRYVLDSGQFKPNCCIAATRIMVDVLSAMDIPVMPIVCEVLLLSPGWVRLREQLGREPTLDEQVHASGHDVWSVGLGAEDVAEDDPRREKPFDPTAWSGHLVAVAQVGPLPFLLDATIRQAERVQYGIRTPRFVRLPISNLPSSVTRSCEGTPTLDQPGGTLVALSAPEPARGTQVFVYRRRAQWNPYRDAPDWSSLRFLNITLALGRDIIEEVGECPGT